jgi:hypothetical protein
VWGSSDSNFCMHAILRKQPCRHRAACTCTLVHTAPCSHEWDREWRTRLVHGARRQCSQTFESDFKKGGGTFLKVDDNRMFFRSSGIVMCRWIVKCMMKVWTYFALIHEVARKIALVHKRDSDSLPFNVCKYCHKTVAYAVMNCRNLVMLYGFILQPTAQCSYRCFPVCVYGSALRRFSRPPKSRFPQTELVCLEFT